MDSTAGFLEAPLADARSEIKAAIRDPAFELADWIRELLDIYDDRFEAYDLVTLPLAYPALGETNSVGIVRISPLDAPSITPTDADIAKDPTSKLAGVRVGHFGGFLDRAWRDNDIMWGRLDAAEVIIDTLVAKDDPRRDALRVRAHAAILRQELQGEARADLEQRVGRLEAAADAALVDAFRAWFKKPAELEPAHGRRPHGAQPEDRRSGARRRRLRPQVADGPAARRRPDRPGWSPGSRCRRRARWRSVKAAPKRLWDRVRGRA